MDIDYTARVAGSPFVKLSTPMIWIAAAFGLLLALVVYRSWPAVKPRSVGLHGGQLSLCPKSPNCVCSLEIDTQHGIAPVKFSGSGDTEWTALVEAIKGMPNALVISDGEEYFHAEFRSTVFRFVDDVELHRDRSNYVIHLRSASRTGHSDLGVNRQRLEQILSLSGLGGM